MVVILTFLSSLSFYLQLHTLHTHQSTATLSHMYILF